MNSPAVSPRVEFKGGTVPAVCLNLVALAPDAVAAGLAAALGGARDFFDGELAVVDLAALPAECGAPDWAALAAVLADHGLLLAAVTNAGEALAASARAAGLANVVMPRAQAKPAGKRAREPEPPAPAPARAASQPAAAEPSRLFDRPLRSGQQVYVRGADAVLLAMASAGSEVIADGSIHVYAPLRGRALAGAGGNAAARIFTTSFEAELVSIAGVYRTFEDGVPEELARKPVQVRLDTGADGSQRLAIEVLKTT